MFQDKTPNQSPALTVQYTVDDLPPKAGTKGEKNSFARVHATGTLSAEDVAQLMERWNNGIKANQAIMMLDALVEVIVLCLKEGKRITIGNAFSFGVSIKGRINPNSEKESDDLELRPWVRCSQVLADTVNQGAKLTRLSADGSVPSYRGPKINPQRFRQT